MGEARVHGIEDEESLRRFTAALLDDLQALQRVLDDPRLERGVRRLGAEQELFLVGADARPRGVAPAILARATDPRLTPEIARFNLEANLTPRLLEGPCLSALHDELREVLALVRTEAARQDAFPVLTGILPTLEPHDLEPHAFSPGARYVALDAAVQRARGEDASVHIEGIDELRLRSASVLLEACNTSFQLHLQTDPEHFARDYNLAQWVSAPLLAAAAGSPLLFDRRLWRETRIALFRQSVDARSEAQRARGGRSRVSFGDAWVRESILELFREDVTRHRPLLIGDDPSEPEDDLPELRALRLHAGTVWRWNRGCYGLHRADDGTRRAHLRVECRVLPSGPSLVDEVANAALFYGLLLGAAETYGDPARTLPFESAREAFLAAARSGLGAELVMPDGTRGGAVPLLRERLLPMAREGLRSAGVDANEADHYLDVVDARVRERRTLAAWLLAGHTTLADARPSTRSATLTNGLRLAQLDDAPVHTWAPLAAGTCDAPPDRRVRAWMSTDLVTLRPGDRVDLAASLMAWRHVRHVPVEDDAGTLLGMLDLRRWLVALSRGKAPEAVRDLMDPNPIVVSPETDVHDALALLREHDVTALAVVENDRLVGLMTERDFLALTERMLAP
ncbi:MAG: CBS domain-containing protein [Sandaracinus sp.]|nr:CBS domain-containing protein [Sandaracinus sp.]